MTRRSCRLLLLLLALALAGCVGWLFRAQIQRYLAPLESDYTPGANLSDRYPRPGADLTPVWKVELEPGYGGAAIDGDEVFVLDREAGEKDTLRVFDVDTGIERWSYSYPAPGRLDFPGSRTTPVVVGDLIYLCGSFGQVHCIDRHTRQPTWSVDLAGDCGGRQPDFGWAASPLVQGRLVILPALGEDVGLVAFNRFTGAMVWKTPALGRSQSAPVVVELLGEPVVLFLATEQLGTGSETPVPTTLTAFDPKNGAEQWQVTTLLTSVPIPPPVRVADDHVLVTGGYSSGSTLLRIQRHAEGVAFEEVFHIKKGSQLHPPVVHDGHIYLLANENSNETPRRRHRGGLVCLDLTGKELWSTGNDPYFGLGHMLLLGDYLLIQDGQSGILRMCHATPQGYLPVATANVFESEPKARKRMWSRMARSNTTLIVRGETELLCVLLGNRSGEVR